MIRNLNDMSRQGQLSHIVEENIGSYCDDLVNKLKGKGKVMAGTGCYATTTNSIIWQLCTGDHTKPSDPQIVNLTELMTNIVRGDHSFLIHTSRFAMKLHVLFGFEPARSINAMLELPKKWVKNAKPDKDGDFIERLLAREPKLAAKKILADVIDVIMAGAETTSIFMEWAILYLMKYPEVQEKAFEEIKRVFGSHQTPRWLDKADTPYCQAVIEEIMRLCPELDINEPHYTTENTEAMGFKFPKDTQVFAFLGGIHKGENYFENAMKFDPDRHIHNGVFKHNPKINFFSFGKRRCAGEILAREEIYVFFTNVVQKFKFELPPNGKLDFTTEFNFLVSPKPYEVLVSCRH